MCASLPLPPPVLSCAGYTVVHNIRKIVFYRLYFLKGFPNWNGISTYQPLKALCVLLSIKTKKQLVVFIPAWKKQEFLNYWDLLRFMSFYGELFYQWFKMQNYGWKYSASEQLFKSSLVEEILKYYDVVLWHGNQSKGCELLVTTWMLMHPVFNWINWNWILKLELI